MAERIQRTLAQAGLERYEISNYARPGLRVAPQRQLLGGWRLLRRRRRRPQPSSPPGRPVGRTVAERAHPDRVHARRQRSRRRGHRARTPGAATGHGGAPVHRATDDRRRLSTSVSTAFRNETRERFPRSRRLALTGPAGRGRPTAALCATRPPAGQRALRSARVNIDQPNPSNLHGVARGQDNLTSKPPLALQLPGPPVRVLCLHLLCLRMTILVVHFHPTRQAASLAECRLYRRWGDSCRLPHTRSPRPAPTSLNFWSGPRLVKRSSLPKATSRRPESYRRPQPAEGNPRH